jgi:sRNA-binding regulator protein Hfq
VAVGDLNGDGLHDLAVANQGNTVSVFFSNGNNTFRPPVNLTAGSTPISVAVGDLNGDGLQDLAAANNGSASNTVSVFFSNGNGTFRPPVNLATGPNPISVAVGDLNHDGLQDLAVATGRDAGSTASVFFSNGNNTFRPRVNLATGSLPTSVAVGDLNHDGLQDLAVANRLSNTVSVFYSNGNNSFQPRLDRATGSQPISVAVGDLNGDGLQDLAEANYHSSFLRVFFGPGLSTSLTTYRPTQAFCIPSGRSELPRRFLRGRMFPWSHGAP